MQKPWEFDDPQDAQAYYLWKMAEAAKDQRSELAAIRRRL